VWTRERPERATLYGCGLKGRVKILDSGWPFGPRSSSEDEFPRQVVESSSGSSGDRRGEGTTHTRPSVSALFSSLLFRGTFL